MLSVIKSGSDNAMEEPTPMYYIQLLKRDDGRMNCRSDPCVDDMVWYTTNPLLTLNHCNSEGHAYSMTRWKQGALLGPSSNLNEIQSLCKKLVTGTRGYAPKLVRLQYLAKLNPQLGLTLDSSAEDTGQALIEGMAKRTRMHGVIVQEI